MRVDNPYRDTSSIPSSGRFSTVSTQHLKRASRILYIQEVMRGRHSRMTTHKQLQLSSCNLGAVRTAGLVTMNSASCGMTACKG